MSQLTEISNIQQDSEELCKRWFSSDEEDLYIWTKEGELYAFEYCYDKSSAEHAFRWHRQYASAHSRVDDGGHPGGYKRSPIAIPEDRILNSFSLAGRSMDKALCMQILEKLTTTL